MRRALLVCVLLAAPTILLGSALLPGKALLPADLLVQFEPWRSHVAARPPAYWDALLWDGIAQYYPWRLFAAESLRLGRLPLWNPYQFCGTPFLANGQSAVLYPPNLIFLMVPVARALAVSAWLHLVLTGWFAYLFLRRIGSTRPGALCAAVVWQTNSFLVAWLHLPTAICTATWLPLALLFCERALTSGRLRYAAAAGTALALSYLGGHPHIFLLVALLAGAYIVARGLSRCGPVPFSRRVLRLGLSGSVIAAVTLALGAAQLLSTLDLVRIAHRATIPGPESYAAFLSRALPTPLLAQMLLPHPLGHPALGTYIGPENYAEYCSYIGICALALALWGALASRTWHARFFMFTVVTAVLLAVGTAVNWPLYHWLPGMSAAGGPARTVLLAVFSLAMLAGVGADAAWRRSAAGRQRRTAWAVLMLALVGAAMLVWWRVAGAAVSRTQPAIGPGLDGEVIRACALLAAAMVLLLCVRRAALRRVAQAGVIAILACDLLLAAGHHAHIVPQEWVYAAQAAPDAGASRIVGNAADWPLNRVPRAVLPPNAATVYGLRDVFGYDSLYLAGYRDFAALIQGGDPSPPANGNLLLARLGPSYGLDMLSLASVGSLLSPTPVRGLQLDRAGAFDVYTNPYVRPRAWITDSAVFVPSRQEAVVAMLRLGGFEDCIVITGPDEPAPGVPPGPRPEATVRDISPNEVIVDLPRGGGGYLFLADAFAPGWRASADGRQVPVRIADVAFRAVPMPEGATSIRFSYEPASFRVGLFVSLLALAALAGGSSCRLALRRG